MCRRYSARACGCCLPTAQTGSAARTWLALAFTRIRVAQFARRLNTERIRWSARIGPALEHAAHLVGDDGANGASEPCPIRPPFDLMSETGKRVSCRPLDAALQIKPAGMIGMRLE